MIRKRGLPTVIKTFRTKRDATDRARRTEEEMVRGVFIDRAASERLLLKRALQRYEAEVVPTKRPSTQRREKPAGANLKAKLGDYSLAAITPDIAAGYRDQRLAEGLSSSTVRLEPALLSHLYTVAIKSLVHGVADELATPRREGSPGAV